MVEKFESIFAFIMHGADAMPSGTDSCDDARPSTTYFTMQSEETRVPWSITHESYQAAVACRFIDTRKETRIHLSNGFDECSGLVQLTLCKRIFRDRQETTTSIFHFRFSCALELP